MKRKGLLATILTIITAVPILVGATLAWFGNSSLSTANVTGTIQRNYFESGTGTKTDPYEIRRPIQMYYFSWLQQMGYFNQEADDNPGNIQQTYFYLSDDIDMSGFTLPSIGTQEYPFVGQFDGKGHVISNLVVQNDSSTLTNEPASAGFSDTGRQIIGFFGVLGSLDGTSKVNGYTYSSQENYVKDFCLNSVAIISDKPKDNQTLIGIVAGYLNCEISGVAICNSSIFVKSGLSPLGNELFDNISDYTTVGYCDDDYLGKVQITTVSLSDVLVQSTSGVTTPGGTDPGGEVINDKPGNNWGGTINMKDLFTRLNDIYNNRADTENSFYESETRYQYIDAPEYNYVVRDSANGSVVNPGASGTGVGTTIGEWMKINKFAIFDQNYDEGAVTFSRSLFDNGDTYIYLMGEIDDSFDMQDDESPYINKVITVHTLERNYATGMHIYSGNNYLTVQLNNGSPTLVNVTDKNSASTWFTEAGTTGQYIFTQINSDIYYLSVNVPNVGLPTLTVVSSESSRYNWNISGNVISVFINNFYRYAWSYITGAEETTMYLRYQNGWSIVEESSKSLFITDGTNYLTFSGSGDTLSVSNTTSSSASVSWTYDTSSTNIYMTYNGNQYYLVNNAGTLQIVSASSITDSMVRTWTTGTSGSNNYIRNTYNGKAYSIEYENGWFLRVDSYYKIRYGSYYLSIDSNKKLVNTTDSNSAVSWAFSNGTSGGTASTRINGTTYYLAVSTVSSAVKLTLSTSVKTSWSTESPNLNSYFDQATVYSLATTYNGVKYLLLCENAVWSVVRSDANRYVVGYKYSIVARDSNSAIWLTHSLSTSTGDDFSTASDVAKTVIYTWDSDGYLYAVNGTTKIYLGIAGGSICSVVHESTAAYKLKVSINSDGEFKCTGKGFLGASIDRILKCNGTRFGYMSSYSFDAILSRPPMSLDYVAGQNIKFVQNDGSMTVETFDSSYFKNVTGSPEVKTQNKVSKLHGTYIPIQVIGTDDANYTKMKDGSTSYVASQRNTGYIVSGSAYQKYDSYSTYRLGDIRVANYSLSDLDSEYFNTTTKEIKKVLTSNSYGADQEYDMDKPSAYFSNAFPKVQSILQSDGDMYGIHFMDAPISASRKITAEKAVIEHVSYYDYEMPESSIDFVLKDAGYINFFAGTYATDVIVGDNNCFFTLFQVFRYQDQLPASAITAIYTADGRPNVVKTREDRYYYYDTSTNSYAFIKNIDNIFNTGKSLDDIYLQVTSGVYMNKNNTSGTLYYTLRNDVTDGHYYTYNPATGKFTLTSSTNVNSNYVLATNITEIKKIKNIYSRYTAAGASSLATKDMIYEYSDGSYSSTGSITKNADGSLSYNNIKYNLVFDVSWLDSPRDDLVEDAIYYFEIPVMKGEYCLGSVDGGKGAYLLYLDISTKDGQGTSTVGDSEVAIVDTQTTLIETYEYVEGISVVSSTSGFTTVPDYETIGLEMTDAGSYKVTRTGNNIAVTTTTGSSVSTADILTYLGYDLTVNGTSQSCTPIKTTVITEEYTILKTAGENGNVTTETYTNSNALIYTNEKVTLFDNQILAVSTMSVVGDSYSSTDFDSPVMKLNVDISVNNTCDISSLTATVVNNSSSNIKVKLIKKTPSPTYVLAGTTKSYSLIISPTSLANVNDTATIAPSTAT